MNNETEKLNIIKNIYWDYDINPASFLMMAEYPEDAKKDELERFFVRAFENVRWHELVTLFGIETIKKLCTDETRNKLRKEARKRFDIACAILREEPLPFTKQDTENRKLAIKPFLSNRRYCS